VTIPDREAHAAAEARAREAMVAPEYAPAALPTHQDELAVAHEGRPTLAEQDKTHSPGLPAVDLGKPIGSVI
jgi:hypothetical protein